MAQAQKKIALQRNEEPPLGELLDDPIALLLMHKDGVERQALDPLLKSLSTALLRRQSQ